MKQTKENKHYFIKDEVLRSIDYDKFNYADVAEMMKRIIETTEPPYNIALVGKWGMGKSSLIRMVTESCKNKNDKVIEVNAWKYEAESLRRVFLRELLEGLEGERVFSLNESLNTIYKEFYDRSKNEADYSVNDKSISKKAGSKENRNVFKGQWKDFWKTVSSMAVACLAIFGITVICLLIYKVIQYLMLGKAFTVRFWGDAFLSYCKNVSTILFIPALVALSKALFDDYRAKGAEKIQVVPQLDTADDYEVYLEEEIKKAVEKKSDCKIVTVIDDLDRLSYEKIVEALDVLKAVMGFDRCVFIVPFDDEIIKAALDKSRNLDESADNSIVSSELILDKIFQFTVYLPPLLAFDIRKYALDLMKQEAPDFLTGYINEKDMNDILKYILIHAAVTTPRQVKKLLNAFINNYMIAVERENSGKVQKGLLTDKQGSRQIAILAVLQVDFNYFYDLLMTDMKCIDKMLNYNNGNNVDIAQIENYLRGYFEPVERNETSPVRIKKEYEALVNFLSSVNKYRVVDMAPYIYLAQDDISRKTGDEVRQRAMRAMESNNVPTLLNILNENPAVADAVSYRLEMANDNMEILLSVGICIFTEIDAEYRNALAKNIVTRVQEFNDVSFLGSMPAVNCMQIAQNEDAGAFGEKFLDKYIENLFVSEEDINGHLLGNVADMIAEHDNLTMHQKELLKQVVERILDSDEITEDRIAPHVDYHKPERFQYYWGIKWFNNLCAYVINGKVMDDSLSEGIRRSFAIMKDVDISGGFDSIVQMAKVTRYLDLVNELLDMTVETTSGNEQLTVKQSLEPDPATELAMAAISCEYKNGKDDICNVLNGLRFEVTDDNAEDLDLFFANFTATYSMDDILVYCGKRGWFSLLPQTVEKLESVIFEDDENDELLQKIQKYLTDVQLRSLIDALQIKSVYGGVAADQYSRLLGIYKILAENESASELLEDCIKGTVLTSLKSYYLYEQYRLFVADVIVCLRNLLAQDTMDVYGKYLHSWFGSYAKEFSDVLKKIPMGFSKDVYALLYKDLITNVSAIGIDNVLDILIANEKQAPDDDESLDSYATMLVSNIGSSSDVNRVLGVVKQSFSWIRNQNELLKNAMKSDACNVDRIAEVLAHFWSAEDNETDLIADTIISCIREDAGIVNTAFAKVLNDKKAILDCIAEHIDDTTTVAVLGKITQMIIADKRTNEGIDVICKALRLAFTHTNQLQDLERLLKHIEEGGAAFGIEKTNLANVLADGFHTSASEMVRTYIGQLVGRLKLSRQFNALLSDEDREIYRKIK